MDRHTALPPTIRTLIHSGEVVYAQIPARQADHDALVWIVADLDEQKGHWERPRNPFFPWQWSDKLILIRHDPHVDPVIGYKVVHREWELTEAYRQDPLYGGFVDYQQEYHVRSEMELMELLHTLHLNGSEFSPSFPVS